jgi:IS5 family transposase
MNSIAEIWGRIQGVLFPHLEEAFAGPLTEKQRQLVAVLEVVRIEEHVPPASFQVWGRKRKDRRAIARAFVVKAVYNQATTELLLELLRTDKRLRQICGWQWRTELPSASTFSRAFAHFAGSGLLDQVHEALVRQHVGERLVGHVSRDSTDIVAREKPVRKVSKGQPPKRPRGRPKKGESRPPQEPTRLQQQAQQSAAQALAELPRACDVGTKVDPHGRKQSWIGYKLHLDVNDAGLPLLAVTTSASLHDSQAAIPMAKLTAQRVTALYELMDSAYDAELIHQTCRDLGQVPLIAQNRRRGTKVPWDPAQERRYQERTAVERAIGRLKEEFGGSQVRVRGDVKVHCHLMFGLLALFADQLLKLVT